MARYKPYNLKQDKFIAVSYADQIVAGSFEHALNEIVEEHLDLAVFEQRYRNDDTGCLAYDPKVLLKIVLYGYSKGIVSSRKLAEACRRNVVFMALSADTRPHFTTIAGFVRELEQAIVSLFRDVLLYCEELGLLGKEHFAVDGCKLPSNASKQWSGTHEELRDRQEKMETAARQIVSRHRERDEREQHGPVAEQDEKKLATYRVKIQKIKTFLSNAKKNLGPSGNERKSNITDPDSAKMATTHGVIQGYNGVAVVDDRHQIVVHAEALGEGQENHLLEPMVKATRETFAAIGRTPDVFVQATLTADSGYHSAKSMEYIVNSDVDAYVADRDMRRRDPAFANAGRYKERHRKERRRRTGSTPPQWFTPADFVYDESKQTCICPAGQKLYRSGGDIVTGGYRGAHFKAPKRACGPCELRRQCLRHPERTAQRQVVFFKGRVLGTRREPPTPPPAIEAMKRKIDSPLGRWIYGRRIATVEPVFGNLQNKGMRRFTLRGRKKVDAQWKLFTLVHNIEKIANYAAA
ncbi:MAG: IS1182 family transposase [Deltaproteobacteria bacterium]|nr:IS1182 family transposase [Deltaproteobacteria bacterium]